MIKNLPWINAYTPNYEKHSMKPKGCSIGSRSLNILYSCCLLLLLSGASFIAKGQVAAFSVTPTSGCAPLIVNFTNMSPAGATSYSWNLGNGTPILTSKDVSSTYTTKGIYTATLTATYGTYTTTATRVFSVSASPTVVFTSTTTACPGAPITFTDASTPNGPLPLTYIWNFGDGDTSTAKIPSHSYAAAGTYSVVLQVTNNAGCRAFSTPSVTGIWTPPSPNFTATKTSFCKPPANVTFNGTTGASKYVWSFGDASTSTSTSATLTHTYTASNAYDVKLIATDGRGCMDSLSKISYINVRNFVAGFTPTTVCVSSPASLVNTSTDTAHATYSWKFGDGSTSTLFNPTHTYSVANTYSVTLTMTDGTCTSKDTQNITISTLPAASFTISPTAPCFSPAATETFTATVPTGYTVTAWKVCDTCLLPLSGNPVTHTYSVSVTDVVSMTFSNGIGCTNVVSKTKTLYNLIHAVNANKTGGCVPLTVKFTDTVSSKVYNALTGHYTNFSPSQYTTYPYPYGISSYKWDFGDGTSSTLAAVQSHTYTAAGSYTVTCTIQTANGCSDVASTVINVGTPPVSSFTMTPTRVCRRNSITFTSTSTGTIDKLTWSFGDGTVAIGPPSSNSVIAHNFLNVGKLTTRLTAEYLGCSSVFSAVVTIDSPKSIINFDYNCTPRTQISFGDSSQGATSSVWLFGDGTTSTAKTPIHVYTTAATFKVGLATYNAASGCRDTAYSFVYLQRTSLTIKSLDTTICRDRPDTLLTAASGAALPIANYNWYVNSMPSGASSPVYIPDAATAATYHVPVSLTPAYLHILNNFHVTGLDTISVVTTDSRGCIDTFVKPNYILVARPSGLFRSGPLGGCPPLLVTLKDTSTDVTGITLKKYIWSFGDGFTATTGSPSVGHSYSTAGTVNITEIVIDSLGCSDTVTVPTTLAINGAGPAFSTTTVVCSGASVSFTNATPRGVSYFWAFGDGATSTIKNPSHAYTAPSNPTDTAVYYTVTLTATDAYGCTDALIRTNYIKVYPLPIAAFSMSDTFAVCPPLNVAFTNLSTDTGAGPTYLWYFGDGKSSISRDPSDIYMKPGPYVITLATTTAQGCTAFATGSLSISGFTGAFMPDTSIGCSPYGVKFNAPGPAPSIVWDFGDGHVLPSPATSISYTYNSAGSYLPKLIMKDALGCTSVDTGYLVIVDSLIPHFLVTPNPVCPNTPVTFTDSSWSVQHSSVTSLLWTFEPGITSTSVTPTHSFSVTSGANVPVTLQVKNGSGCVKTTTVNVTVHPGPQITGYTTICKTATTTLSSSVSGTWSSSNTAVAKIKAGTGVITAVDTGTTIITLAPTTGCNATITVTVSLPAVISGSPSICAGQTTTLSAAGPGGSWSSSNTVIATIGTTGIVTAAAAAAGTTTITYSASGYGCSAYQTVTTNPNPSISGTMSVCPLLTTALTGTPTGGGGAWSSSNTSLATVGSTGLVQGVSGGSVTISYTRLGCSAMATVSVSPLPGAITTSGSFRACPGTTTSLGHPVTGGTWSSSTPAVGTINAVTGVFMGVSAMFGGVSPATTTVTYTLPGGCIATASVTVYPIPVAISGTTNVCQGESTSLSDVTPGGVWSSDNTAIAIVNLYTGIASGISPGSAMISYWANGCSTVTSVTVNPLPGTISGSAIACVGLYDTLSASISGGTWSSSSTAVAVVGSMTGVVTGLVPGFTNVTYTLPTGCMSDINMIVNPPPPAITGITRVCEGATTTLSDTSPGGHWSSADVSTASVDLLSGVVTGKAAGTTTISYSISGCPATTSLTVNPVSRIMGLAVACLGGGTNTLSAAIAGGTWNSGSPSVMGVGYSSGVLTGISLGAANITYTLPTGCVTVIPAMTNPLPSGIIGPARVCYQNTITLSDTTAGGTWSSSDTGIAAVNAFTGVVTGASVHTATITYIANGCPTHTVITVDRLPAPIICADSICAWGSTTLATDADSIGTWNGILVTTDSKGLVTSGPPGIGTIIYKLPISNCFVTRTITVNPLPSSIAGSWFACTGSTTTLSDATPGGAWSTGASGMGSVDAVTGVVTGLGMGQAVITYTIPKGGCITTKTMTVDPQLAPITGMPSVCAGASDTLSDPTPPPNGRWTSSNTAIATVGSASGIVTGGTQGIVNITYSVTLCRPLTATKTLTVNPLPNAGTIMGPSSVCPGAAISLTDPAPGGVWSCSNTSATIDGSGIVTGVSVGIDTVIYTVNNICGQAQQKHSVTINPLPVAGTITGVDTLCKNAHSTLTTSVTGGAWSSGDPAIVYVDGAGLITGISGGTDTIKYTVTNSCGSDTAKHAVTIIRTDAGQITGATQVCVGEAITLGEDITGGTWSGSNDVASVSGGVVTGLSKGTAVIRYTVVNYCGTLPSFFSLTVNPLPNAGTITGTDSVCPGDTVVFENAHAGGDWTHANLSVASLYPTTDGKAMVIGVAPGTDSATYTVTSTGCSSAATFPFRVRSQSVCDPAVDTVKRTGCSGGGEINVYPNPSHEGQFNVYLLSSQNEEAQLIITNTLGQRIYKEVSITNTPIPVDLNLAPGNYNVLAVTSHGQCIEKVMVTR